MKDKGEREGRLVLRWVDVLLLVAVLAVILGSLAMLFRNRKEEGQGTSIQYVICLRGLDPELSDSFRPDPEARVCNLNGTACLGTVLATALLPHRRAILSDGSPEIAEDGSWDLYVTVRTEAVQREGDGWRVCDIRIAAGMRADVRIGGYLAQGAEVLWIREDAE